MSMSAPLSSADTTTLSSVSSLARLSNSVLPPLQLNVGVFSRRKGVRYFRDGQVCSCRFCEILRTRTEPLLYEDDEIVVFRPLRPIVPTHVLIVPRAHIRNVNRLAARHRGLLIRMHHVARALMTEEGPENRSIYERFGLQAKERDDSRKYPVRYSFHVPPFNSIDHVHMHAFHDDLRRLGYYDRLKYRTQSWWCRSLEQVLEQLPPVAADMRQLEADASNSRCLQTSTT